MLVKLNLIHVGSINFRRVRDWSLVDATHKQQYFIIANTFS